MRIDLTGSEYPSIQADLCPGFLSVLTRAVEGVADGQVQFEHKLREVANNVAVRLPSCGTLPPLVIYEGKVDIESSWEGVLLVETASLNLCNQYEVRAYTIAVEANREALDGPVRWTVLLSAQTSEGVCVTGPVGFESVDRMPNPKTVYDHLQDELDSVTDGETA